MYNEIAPYINYDQNVGNSTATRFYAGSPVPADNVANRTFPGLTMGDNDNDFVVESTGQIYIPQTGNWSFAVNSDEGFQLWISGQGQSFTSGAVGTRTSADSIYTWSFNNVGWYDVKLVYFERSGGAQEEFYACQGSLPVGAFLGPNNLPLSPFPQDSVGTTTQNISGVPNPGGIAYPPGSLGYYPLVGGGSYQWRLVGDVAHGGLRVVYPQPTIGSVAQDAERTIGSIVDGTSNSQYRVTTVSEIAPYINYLDSGSTAASHYDAGHAAPSDIADRPYPGLTSGLDNNDFVTQIQTQVYIPDFENYAAVCATAPNGITISSGQAGVWTFAVNTDEAYRLTVIGTVGHSVSWTNSAAVKQPTDSFQHFTLAAGTYSAILEWLNNTGGSNIELYAAQGNYTSWADSAGTAYPWALIGDAADGGLAVAGGWSTTVYKAAYGQTVSTLTEADNLIDTPSLQMWTQSETGVPYINYLTTGINDPSGAMDGHFYSGNLLPGNVANRMVPGGNQYAFGVNSDEGFSFNIANSRPGGGAPSPTSFGVDGTRQAGDTLQTITFAEPGLYNLRVVTFDRGDAAEIELFAAPGSPAAFDPAQFRLIGDTADGGLLATVPGSPYVMNVNVAETLVTNNTTTGLGQVRWSDASASSYQAWTQQHSTPFVNYCLAGPSGHFTGAPDTKYFDSPFPGLPQGTESDDFAVVAQSNLQVPAFSLADYVGNATATIAVPAAGGTYTFGVTTDDGFRLTLGGGLALSSVTNGAIVTKNTVNDSITSIGTGTPGDTLGVVTFPATANPTNYALQLEWFNHSGGSMIELYSASGSLTRWIDANNWALVGNTANGGLPITGNGFTTTIYKASVSVTTMALADTVIATPSQQTWVKAASAPTSTTWPTARTATSTPGRSRCLASPIGRSLGRTSGPSASIATMASG